MAGGAGIASPVRGEITDRNGKLLAANLPAFSLYAHPREIKNPAAVADDLAAIFPNIPAEKLIKSLTRGASFVWIKRPITPQQRQQVLDLGYPGLKFGSRAMRRNLRRRCRVWALGQQERVDRRGQVSVWGPGCST